MSFSASHTIPNTGLQSFPAPDPSQPEGPRLEAGLEVEVLERNGDWARVACSNGWECWVNGTVLVDRSTPPPPPPPVAPPAPTGPPTASAAPTAPTPTAKPIGGVSFEPLNFGVEYGVGPLAVIGAALVIASSFLSWLSVFSIGVSSWDIPLSFLLSGENASRGGLKLGLLLLVSAGVVFLPLAMRKRDHRIVLGGGVAAAALVVLAFVRLVSTDGLDPSVGLFVGAAGAGAVIYDAVTNKT